MDRGASGVSDEEASTQPPFLILENLNKAFGSLQVLENLNLEVNPGEILALLGPSGSGKSTLLRIVAGFETADSGELLVEGESIQGTPPNRRGFGMVFQSYALFPHMSVGENIAFGLEAKRFKREEISGRVEEMLRLVNLAGFGSRRVAAISGGQQQRVALARALAPRPRLLMLDEPLSNLDPALRERTRSELRTAIREVGITTLLVTHEQEEAFDMGDRVALLNAGRLEQVATPRELYRSPATRFVAEFVGRSCVLVGQWETRSESKSSIEGSVVLRQRSGFSGPAGPSGPSVRWELDCACPTGTPQLGDRVEFLVRPEDLELCGVGDVSALAARVVGHRFVGPLTYVSVVTEPENSDQPSTPLEVVLAGRRNTEVGTAVGVRPVEARLPASIFLDQPRGTV